MVFLTYVNLDKNTSQFFDYNIIGIIIYLKFEELIILI